MRTNKKSISIVFFLVLITVGSASAADVYVTVRESKLRTKPEFLASATASVRYGDKLSVVKDSEPWMQVSIGGKQGYIHSSAITTRKVVLSASKGSAGANVDQSDVVLAGKGFSSDVEKQFAATHSNLSFASVDAMERVRISTAELEAFVKQGKLVPSGS
jgi:uncharacterized protein YgiM (DUF1202 family)